MIHERTFPVTPGMCVTFSAVIRSVVFLGSRTQPSGPHIEPIQGFEIPTSPVQTQVELTSAFSHVFWNKLRRSQTRNLDAAFHVLSFINLLSVACSSFCLSLTFIWIPHL